MSVFLTKEEVEFKKEIREYVQENITQDMIKRIIDFAQNNDYSAMKEAMKILGDKGMLGNIHPKKYGGTERGMMGECICAEETAYINGALELSRLVNATLFGMPLSVYGKEWMKEKYLPGICKGEVFGCIAMTEEEAGSDLAAMKAVARKEGDEYVINGHKRYITNGGEADLVNLFVVLEDIEEKDPRKRMIGVLVETAKTKGFKIEKQFDLAGCEGISNVKMVFEDMRVPVNNLLGKEGQGFEILMAELNEERCGMAAVCVGNAQATFDIALRYSNERVQFGRPLSRQQGVSFRIADCYTKIQATRLLTYEAARLIDMHDKRQTLAASMAFTYAKQMLIEVSNDCMLTLGGEGITDRYNVSCQMWRMGPIMWTVGGTYDVQKHIVQRELYRSLKKK
ncbi:MAG: acyl-CoA dehydrogenase family protein [Candidatus Helarchaeota archaeon]